MPAPKTSKEQILTEAARLFHEKGYFAATLRDLAKRCGIQAGSVYYHFSSKQELLLQLMEYVLDELTSRVQEAVASSDDPIDQLKRAVTVHIDYHISHLPETYVTDSEIKGLIEDNYSRILRKRKRYESIFIEILRQGIDAGLIRDIDTKLCTYAMLQMFTGVSYWFKEKGRLSKDEIAERYFDLILSGLAA